MITKVNTVYGCVNFAVLFLFKSRTRGRVVVLVGPSETGKTALFVHLQNNTGTGDGEGVETVTSTVANVAEYVSTKGKQPLTIKDLPGHDRVRNKWWDSNKKGLRGIVCIVDAAGGNKSIRESADVLYTILTDSTVNSIQPNILILANKQDLLMAKSEKVIKSLLEREITTLRLTKSASLQTTTGGGGTIKVLGNLNQDFEFEHVPMKVEFGKTIAKSDGEPDLKDLVKWLDTIS